MSTHYVVVKMGLTGPRGTVGPKGDSGGLDTAGAARVAALETAVQNLSDRLDDLEARYTGHLIEFHGV